MFKYFLLLVVMPAIALHYPEQNQDIAWKLFFAMEYNDVNGITQALQQVNPSEVRHPLHNLSPLCTAASSNSIQQLEIIMNAGACDVQEALYTACEYGRVEAMRFLVKAGASVDLCKEFQNKKKTPLMWASVHVNRIHVARELLSYGVRINYQEAAEYTALAYAVESQSPQLVTLFLQQPQINVLALVEHNKELKTVYFLAKFHFFKFGPSLDTKDEFILGLYRRRKSNLSTIGRMLLTQLRFYSAQGGVSKRGLQQILPLDILKYMASLIDYEDAAKAFKV